MFLIAQVGDGLADRTLELTETNPLRAQPWPSPLRSQDPILLQRVRCVGLLINTVRDHGEIDYANKLDNAQSLFDFAVATKASIGFIPRYFLQLVEWVQDELAYENLGWRGTGRCWPGWIGLQAEARIAMLQDRRFESAWAPSWDDASYGTAVLLSQDLDQQALDDVSAWIESWVTGDQGPDTDGGLRFVDQ